MVSITDSCGIKVDEDNFYQQCAEAHWRARQYARSGVRGQTITPRDSIEYWVYEVTKEFYEDKALTEKLGYSQEELADGKVVSRFEW